MNPAKPKNPTKIVVDRTKFPEVLSDRKLSSGAKTLFVLLHNWPGFSDPSPMDVVITSNTILADRLGASRLSIDKWKKELITRGLITIR